MELSQLNCCGIYELTGIQYETLHRTLNFVKNRYIDGEFVGRFIIFSDTPHSSMAGKKLATYVRDRKLGKTSVTNIAKNPNSGNKLKVWIWQVNLTNLRKFK